MKPILASFYGIKNTFVGHFVKLDSAKIFSCPFMNLVEKYHRSVFIYISYVSQLWAVLRDWLSQL